VERLSKMNKIIRNYVQQFGVEPDRDEIARRLKMPVSKVVSIMKLTKEPMSIEDSIGAENESFLKDYIEDKTVPSPLDAVVQGELKSQLDMLLGSLSIKEESVIRKRYGLGEDFPLTLEEVGNDLEVTRERIRQIELKAIRKLKKRLKNTWLRDFFKKS
ncbi:MAG: sigma-70 family RNA polymerase sigma factor, partial [Nitrospirae bacterium]|nr:sigma-70 family RNA polymerase sigma factor [Nitrospirota bacterium]